MLVLGRVPHTLQLSGAGTLADGTAQALAVQASYISGYVDKAIRKNLLLIFVLQLCVCYIVILIKHLHTTLS